MMRDTQDGHPRFRTLLDHRDGVLSGRRAVDVAEHLGTGCASCAEEVATLDALVTEIGEGPLPAPPAAVVRRVKSLFVKRRVRDAVQRVLAALVFDERLTPAPALRSAVGSARRLLFRAEGIEVFVELSRTRDGWTLLGEVLPERDEGRALNGVVFVRRGERVLARVDLSADGTFVAEGLPDGVLSVEGRIDGEWIELPPIVTG